MCGRFVSASSPEDLADYFDAAIDQAALGANFNVAPTHEVPIVRAVERDRTISVVRWGLVPFWAKDLKIGSKMINARAETVAEKPAFRSAFAKRRCLIPADGFYEWAKIPGQKNKQPYYIYRTDGEPLVFAGLWERWKPKDDAGEVLEDELVETFTVLTTSANGDMEPVHNRMPVMVPPTAWDSWLDPATDQDELLQLAVPAPDGLLELRPVSTAVNRVANNAAHLLDVVDVAEQG